MAKRAVRLEIWSEDGGTIVAGGTVADKLICIKCPENKKEILKTFEKERNEWKEDKEQENTKTVIGNFWPSERK